MKRVVLPVILFIVLWPSLSAQAGTTWIKTLLNGHGNENMSVDSMGGVLATYNAGEDRYEGTCTGVPPGSWWGIEVLIDVDTSTITKVHTVVSWNSNRAGSAWRALKYDNATEEDAQNFTNLIAYATTNYYSQNQVSFDTADISINPEYIDFNMGTPVVDCTAGYYSRLDEVQIWGTGTCPFTYCDYTGGPGLTRPLSEDDELTDFGAMWDWPYVKTLDDDYDVASNQVFAFSNSKSAPVFAAADATVEAVLPFTLSMCTDGDGGLGVLGHGFLWYSDCVVVVPQPVIVGALTNQVFRLDMTNLYRVALRMDVNTIIYYVVADAPQYVNPGDTISGGCILGRTAGLRDVGGLGLEQLEELLGISSGVISVATNYGIAILESVRTLDGVAEIQRLLPVLTDYGTFDEACNADPQYSSCIGDATLAHPSEWQTSGYVAWQNPGAELQPQAQIRATFNLAPSTDYSMTVTATKTGPLAAAVRLQIGATVESTTITTAQFVSQHAIIAAAEHEPDAAGFYTISVTNLGAEYLEIKSICVTEGTPNLAPSSCYFNNADFDYGGSGWLLDEGITPGDGTLFVPSEDTFSQNLHLYPNDSTPRTYNLRIQTKIWASSLWDPATSTGSVSLEYDWDSAGYEFMYDTFSWTSPATVAQFAQGNNYIEFGEDLTVSDETDGVIVFKPTLDTTDTEIYGISILKVCIEGPFPHPQDPDIDYGGNPLELDAACQFIAPPAGNNISSWISWLWSKLNKFFTCDLMVLLNKLFKAMKDFFNTVSYAIRWSQTSMRLAADWFSDDFAPWLAGYLTNAQGSTTIIQAGGSTCEWWNLLCWLSQAFNNVSDLLGDIINQIIGPLVDTLLYLVRQAFDLLLGVLSALLALALQLIGLVLSLLGLLIQLLGAVINAYNTATPATIPGLPVCTGAPTSDIWCAAMWVFEHTAFSGPGAAIIPLIIAIASVHLVLWLIGELKGVFLSAGESL